jgi:hypothetical protein
MLRRSWPPEGDLWRQVMQGRDGLAVRMPRQADVRIKNRFGAVFVFSTFALFEDRTGRGAAASNEH